MCWRVHIILMSKSYNVKRQRKTVQLCAIAPPAFRFLLYVHRYSTRIICAFNSTEGRSLSGLDDGKEIEDYGKKVGFLEGVVRCY